MIRPPPRRLLYMAGGECRCLGPAAGAGSGPRVAVRASYARAVSDLRLVRPLLTRADFVVVLTPPGRVDLALIDALAALALSVRRSGGHLRVCAAGEQLTRLAALTGLAEVLAVRTCSGQPQGQSQAGEQLSAEEVVDVGDPSA